MLKFLKGFKTWAIAPPSCSIACAPLTVRELLSSLSRTETSVKGSREMKLQLDYLTRQEIHCSANNEQIQQQKSINNCPNFACNQT